MKNTMPVKIPSSGAIRWPIIFPENTKPRILLFFFAIIIQLFAAAISGVGFSLNRQFYWLAGTALWILWFAMMFIIAAPKTDVILRNYQNRLKKAALVLFGILMMLGIFELIMAFFLAPVFQNSGDFATLLEQMRHGFQYNDGTALEQQATENFLKGENPYAHANLIEAMLKYDGSFDRVTPLRTGRLADVFPYPTQEQLKQIWDTAIHDPSQAPPEIESKVCYPAGFFLIPAPFVVAGITDMRIIYFIFVIAGLAYAVWKVPKKNKFILIAFAVISLELWNSLADGETGSIVFPFLLIAWMGLGKNRWTSAIAMGLAVTTKQTAWFYLPFYLILLWHRTGLKSLIFTGAVIAMVFILTNAYYIVLDPGLWLTSILSPMKDPMFPIGVGLVNITTSGLVNIKSPLPFTILEILTFIGAIIWYIRNCARYPLAGVLISVLPLFFAWRSLWSYFFYVPMIMLTCMLLESDTDLDTANYKITPNVHKAFENVS